MERLSVNRIVLSDNDDQNEFYYEISNPTDTDILLSDFILYEQDNLEDMGLDPSDCALFRSGRHKNDMPSVFRLGQRSAAMEDAISGMTETGDKVEVNHQERRILSDHLTVFGSEKRYVVISFPTGRNQMVETAVYVDDSGRFIRLQSKVIFNIRLRPGQRVETERLCIRYTTNVLDAIDSFARDKALRYGARNQAHPSVFCTWYYYGLTVTYEDVMTNLREMTRRRLPFDVFQIDEGWEITLGEWKPNAKFPVPMADIATQIREAGYRPGIWTSPFVAHETASIWKEHPEWILKDQDGNPCLFPMNDTVYQVFDITNPATWEYFRELYYQLTYEWGYTYHKLDFTRAAVIMENAEYFDDSITIVEAYYEAVHAIREGMGESSYLLMCGGLYDPIIGLVDAQRTGSDVLSMWSSTINKGGKTAPYTMKQSILRYYMNAWWNNDPDALMVRINNQMERNLRLTYGLLNEEEVKTVTINQYMGGGIVCSTEPLDKIDDTRLSNLKRIMPVVPVKALPLELMNCEKRYPENVKLDIIGHYSVSIVRINWSDEDEMVLEFLLEKNMLPSCCNESDQYTVCDYYGKVYKTDVKVGDMVTLGVLKPHGATVIKIEKQSGQPIIVESTGHYSMGAEGIHMAMKDGRLAIKYSNPFDWLTEYKVMLPAGYVTKEGERVVTVQIAPLQKVEKEWGYKNAN